MQEKKFKEIASIISQSAKYDEDKRCVVVDVNKINLALSKFGNGFVNRIIDAANRIAEERSLRMKNDDLSLEYNLDQLKVLLKSTILGFAFSNATISVDKEMLIDQINSAQIEDQEVVTKISKSIDDIFYHLNKKEVDENNIITAFTDFRNALENLRYYKDHIKLPTWVGEIFVRQENNKVIAQENFKCIEELKARSIEFTSELQKCSDNANDLHEAMSKNNDLLSRIEAHMNSKKESAERLIQYLKKFQTTVTNGLILQVMRIDNNDPIGKLELLYSALKTNNDLNSTSSINEQIKVLKSFSIRAEIREINLLERLINIQSSDLGDKLKKIHNEIPRVIKSLDLYREKLIKNIESPITEEIFVWERSNWEFFKTFFANFSKFFIGYENHCEIYGHPDGVEELRRAVEDFKEIKALDSIE